MKAMFVTKIKSVLAVTLAVGLALVSIGVGVGLATNPETGAERPGVKADEAKKRGAQQKPRGRCMTQSAEAASAFALPA